MHESDTGRPDDRPRRQLLACLLAAGVSGEAGLNNPLLWAVAWKQTAAEYFALCHQAYNLARMQLEKALQHHDPQGKPLAVITDMDDTVMHAASYWGHLINENNDFFDDAVWDRWVPKNLVTPVPGAKDFLSFCEREGVEVFYVTSRNQGEKTYEFALGQLRFLEFPFADPEHLTVYRDTSDKSPARTEIGQTHNVVLLIGDNLNDFKRDYYLKDVDERRAAMEHDRAEFGTRFILLPNPTDGHWVRAIFGASEPEASNANRRTLRQAATRVAWDGQ
jgi:5'-nucleotidase (lipoprotein e(P4) family)